MRLTAEAKANIIETLEGDRWSPFTPHQLRALNEALSGQNPDTIRPILDRHLLNDRINLGQLCGELKQARTAANRITGMPEHSPQCPHGCEGEGWLPGPAEQLDRMTAGETTVALARCPGPPLTPDLWEAEQATAQARHTDRWTPRPDPGAASARMKSILNDARIEHLNQPPKETTR